ncbi:hypothetical protein BD289DRAFT_87431 [Coniella lustricola]|uniref:Uncharacterized protein n=1 Tax=Coniella lustricola TaxID=2025994 RepID=A0A2T2ZYT1_9PEZI|nr:hypothetical protein BD289DRAFT_87431 [Coniella lustricola]
MVLYETCMHPGLTYSFRSCQSCFAYAKAFETTERVGAGFQAFFDNKREFCRQNEPIFIFVHSGLVCSFLVFEFASILTDSTAPTIRIITTACSSRQSPQISKTERVDQQTKICKNEARCAVGNFVSEQHRKAKQTISSVHQQGQEQFHPATRYLPKMSAQNHHHRHRHLSSLTDYEVTALATLLSLPRRLFHPTTGQPSALWLAAQECMISAKDTDTDTNTTNTSNKTKNRNTPSNTPPAKTKTSGKITRSFPTSLQRPTDMLSRLSMSANRRLRLTIDDAIPQCAALCEAHRGLNPWIVRRVTHLLVREITGDGSEGGRSISVVEGYLWAPGRYHWAGKRRHDEDQAMVERQKKSGRTMRMTTTTTTTKLDSHTVMEMGDFVDRMHGLVRRRGDSHNRPDDRNSSQRLAHPSSRVYCNATARHSSYDNHEHEDAISLQSTCEACFLASIGGDATAL